MSIEVGEKRKPKPIAQKVALTGISCMLLCLDLLFSWLIWKCLIVFLRYSDYLGWRAAISKPILMTTILFVLIIAISVTMFFLFKSITKYADTEEVLKFLERIKSWSYRLSNLLIIINGLILSFYILLHYDILSVNQYAPFSSEVVKEIAIHESGHCLVNEVEFPNTTNEIRIFDKDDSTAVDIYLGSQLVKNIPGGQHSANIDLRVKDDLYKRIKVSLAGLASEELLSPRGEASLGASGDLKNVKDTVVLLVNNGLSSMGPVQWDLLTPDQREKIYSEIVTPLNNETKEIILKNKDQILKLSVELEKKRVIKGSEARKILGVIVNTK